MRSDGVLSSPSCGVGRLFVRNAGAIIVIVHRHGNIATFCLLTTDMDLRSVALKHLHDK